MTMHQTRRRWPMHVIAPAFVALGVGGLLLFAARETFQPTTPAAVHPVLFAGPAAMGDAPAPDGVVAAQPAGRAVQAPGWLEADPYIVAAAALADGVVETIDVLEGESVEKGEIVARLVDEDARIALASAKASLRAAEAQVIAARTEFEAAETNWEIPVERERAVAATAAQVASAEADLAQLPALIEVEEAKLARMQEELTRLRIVYESAGASDLELIILEKESDAQAAQLEALRRRRPILEAKVSQLRAEARAAERNAELRVDEKRALGHARAELARAEAAVALAQAKHDESQLRLDRMVIRAPISGNVQRRLKAPGDKVMAGMDSPYSAHLVHLYDPAKIQVRVDVPLADAAFVSVGQRCEVVVDVLPEQIFAGEVTRITHEADLQKNTLQVKVRVIEPSPLLRPEMLTRVKFLPSNGGGVSPRSTDAGGGSPTGRLVRAPIETLSNGGALGSAHVWVVRQRRGGVGVLERADVEVLPVTDDDAMDGWASVRGDLRPGDLLVNAGAYEAGQRIRIREPKGATS